LSHQCTAILYKVQAEISLIFCIIIRELIYVSYQQSTWWFGLIGRINKVNQRQVRLILRWVTVSRRVNHLGM